MCNKQIESPKNEIILDKNGKPLEINYPDSIKLKELFELKEIKPRVIKGEE